MTDAPKDRSQFDCVVPLVCPQTRKPLIAVDDTLVSTDAETRFVYRIVDGIPVLRPETAESMDAQQWQTIMKDRPSPSE